MLIFQHPLPRRNFSSRAANLYFYSSLIRDSLIMNDAPSVPAQNFSAAGNQNPEGSTVRSDNAKDQRPVSQNQPVLHVKEDDEQSSNSIVNLFSIGTSEILVQSDISGHRQVESGREPVKIFPKIELQVSAGMEQFSVSDIVEVWWSSFLSNIPSVLCCRFDPRSNTFVRTDKFDRAMFCTTGSPYLPRQSIKFLQSLFDTGLKLTPGNYILEHSPGSTHACIYRESQENSMFRIEKLYQGLIQDKTDIIHNPDLAYLPIDTQVIPQVHKEQNEVPCTFPTIKNKKKKTGGKRPFKYSSMVDDLDHVQIAFVPEANKDDLGSSKAKRVVSYDDVDFADF